MKKPILISALDPERPEPRGLHALFFPFQVCRKGPGVGKLGRPCGAETCRQGLAYHW